MASYVRPHSEARLRALASEASVRDAAADPPSDGEQCDEDRRTEVESAVGEEHRRASSDAGTCRSRGGVDKKSSNRFEDYMAHVRPSPNKHARRDDAIHEKQNILMDISRLKMQGVNFSKEWTIDDSVDDMQYELRRQMLHVEEMNNMKMMRDGMHMICTGIEMLNGRMQILELNGWAADVCSDMSTYDPALSKLYRKYWRKTQSSSPEMEIATGVLMSMGMYHFKRKLASRMFPGPMRPATASAAPSTSTARRRSPSPARSDTSSEDLPP